MNHISHMSVLFEVFVKETENVGVLQNVKAVFDAAIKVVLQPPKQKKKKKNKNRCMFL